jgi:segregation and condensation protein A
MVSLPSEFRAKVETYSGPLDLLLYLIKKDEVDIFDIPIASIIGQYSLYLEVLRDLDPNVCGEFLVVAANLMEIKSKLLLPREELEEDGDLEDPRMELVRQLLEYKKFKERALLLESRLDSHRKRHHRPSTTIPELAEDLAAPLPMGNIDVWDLLTAFHRIQIALGQRMPVQVVVERRPVSEFMDEIRDLLSSREDRSASFDDLFAGARTRDEALGYFLAILELAKCYELVIVQEELGAPISVGLRDEQETLQLQTLDAQDVDDRPDPVAQQLLQGEGREAALEEPRPDFLDDKKEEEEEE